jgi:E3 ubiquitin-protein ligase DOA10
MQERVRERFMELYQLDVVEAQKQEQKQQQQQQQQQQSDDDDNNNNKNQDNDNEMVVIPSWTFVDAAQSVEQVEQDVWTAVQETIRKVREQNKPVGKMFAPGTLQLPTTTSTTPSVIKNDVNESSEHDDWEILATVNNVSDEENQKPPTTTTSTGNEEATKVD